MVKLLKINCLNIKPKWIQMKGNYACYLTTDSLEMHDVRTVNKTNLCWKPATIMEQEHMIWRYITTALMIAAQEVGRWEQHVCLAQLAGGKISSDFPELMFMFIHIIRFSSFPPWAVPIFWEYAIGSLTASKIFNASIFYLSWNPRVIVLLP